MMCHRTSLLLEMRETKKADEIYRLLEASEQQVIQLTKDT